MDRFRDRFLHPAEIHQWHSLGERNPRPQHGVATLQTSEFRQFALLPIVGPSKQAFGSEAVFRAGWEDHFSGDPDSTSRIMLDNWLLYGFEELAGGRTIFLKCTRDILLSGFLSLLPRSAVFEILDSVKPDQDVLSACRSLKTQGYRFALDDFESPETMEAFLHLADFIKVDFRHSGRRERARMLRGLRLTGATLIAEQIESEEEYHQAVEQGFGLFQGDYFGGGTTYVKKRDALNPLDCTEILGVLHNPDLSAGETDELVKLIDQAPGIECRLLRKANWAAASGVVINSTRDSLDVVGKADLQKIVILAMTAASEKAPKNRPIPHLRTSMRSGADNTLIRWINTGARTPWWWQEAGRGNAL
jgi:EAL and modified HD-GYP domain-containing signal transduction protein